MGDGKRNVALGYLFASMVYKYSSSMNTHSTLMLAQLLVTSNDSRVRMYNLKDHSLSCKYKGGLNTSSQIKATFR